MPAVAWVGRRVWPSVQLLHRCRGLLEASLLIDCDATETSPTATRSATSTARTTGPRNRRSRAAGQATDMRAWAAEQAVRCGGCVLVVADGSGFSRVMTQRLQLASEAGSCSCLLARPPGDITCLSAATTRWLVKRAAEANVATDRLGGHEMGGGPFDPVMLASGEVWSTGWIARLWRSKGAAPATAQMEREQAWLLRMVHRVDDVSRFNDLQRNAPRRARGDDPIGVDLAPGGFDLVPFLVDRPGVATDATSCDARRFAG